MVKNEKVDAFALLLSKSSREKLSIETHPYKCPQCRSVEICEILSNLKRHWTMLHPSKRMSEILISASEGMRLSKEIQEIKPCRKDLKTPKKKVDALTQRQNASLVKKVNSKDLPQGWTKEKVAMAYHMAGQRGKGKFLKMWKDKYVFKLSQ